MSNALTDRTIDKTWNYDSEAQLKTATRLYMIQHPKSSVAVTISGKVTVLR